MCLWAVHSHHSLPLGLNFLKNRDFTRSFHGNVHLWKTMKSDLINWITFHVSEEKTFSVTKLLRTGQSFSSQKYCIHTLSNTAAPSLGGDESTAQDGMRLMRNGDLEALIHFVHLRMAILLRIIYLRSFSAENKLLSEGCSEAKLSSRHPPWEKSLSDQKPDTSSKLFLNTSCNNAFNYFDNFWSAWHCKLQAFLCSKNLWI